MALATRTKNKGQGRGHSRGKVNTGKGKDAGRERDETGPETQGGTRGENGEGEREGGGGLSGPTREKGRRSVTTKNERGTRGKARWREKERNAKRGDRGEAARRESREGDLMNGDVRGGTGNPPYPQQTRCWYQHLQIEVLTHVPP